MSVINNDKLMILLMRAGRPGFFSPMERAKWDAWKAVESTSKKYDLNLRIDR